jgi:hypothetical protein
MMHSEPSMISVSFWEGRSGSMDFDVVFNEDVTIILIAE